jgi:thiol-disulfide isomerase/thioredoxin
MRSHRFLPTAAVVLCALLLGVIARPQNALALKEGDAFPAFTGQDLNGAAFDSKAFGKKLLLVDFWSVYCSSCVAEMPHIVALYTKYKDKGLQCVGIDLDPMMPAAKVKKFLEGQSFPMPYPNVQDNKRQIMGLLGVSMLPTTILVDESGTVRLFHVGYKPGFEKELEEIVKKFLPAK